MKTNRKIFEARFSFFWDWSGLKPVPNFFVVKSNIPSLIEGSTVDDIQIKRERLPIPYIPMPQTWRYMVKANRRCGRCFSEIRTDGVRDHNRVVHFLDSDENDPFGNEGNGYSSDDYS